MLLTGNSHEGYLMPVQVGKQVFEVLVDTASPNLILPGDGCSGCGPHTHPYLPGAGSVDLHIHDYLEYGRGSVYGDFYVDNVQVSNFEPRPIAVMSVIASSVGDMFYSSIFSAPMSSTQQTQGMPGILGIAPSNEGYLNRHGFENVGNDSYMNALTKEQGLLAVQLCDSGGFIWFGTRNCSHSQAEPIFEYVAMPQADVYYAALGSMSLKDEEVNPSPTYAVFDTAAGWLILAHDVYKVFMDTLQDDFYVQQLGGFDSFGCVKKTPHNIDDYLPDLTVGFTASVLNETDLVKKTIPASKSYMVQRRQGGSFRWCHVVLQNKYNDAHIFGAPMMRHFVTIFDTSRNRLGFAPQEPGTCPVSPPSPSSAPPPPPHIRLRFPWWIILSIVCIVSIAGGLVLGCFRHKLAGLQLNIVGRLKTPQMGTLEACLTEQCQTI